LQLAALATPVAAAADVPLARAAGRVLAADLESATDAAAPLDPRGTRLDARHLPLLVGAGRATASVLARVRIGVIALPDDEDAPPRRCGAAASAAWIAATLERLGAQAFEATCRAPDAKRLLATLEMFGGGCDLVVTAGFLRPDLCAAVRDAQARLGQPDTVETLSLRPFGALQALQVGSTRVIAIPASLESAVAAFTTLLTPLVRRLQGRIDVLPDVRAAELDGAPRHDAEPWRLFPARLAAGALNARLALARIAGTDADLALAAADGLAWHAAEFASFDRLTVAYFPFETWTR
jgi:molybdopterin molybdotransferase